MEREGQRLIFESLAHGGVLSVFLSLSPDVSHTHLCMGIYLCIYMYTQIHTTVHVYIFYIYVQMYTWISKY